MSRSAIEWCRTRCRRWCEVFTSQQSPALNAGCIRLSCGDRLPVAPRGDFLDVEKVTKDTFRRRGFRFPRLLKTSTLEPAKRNRARFPFDSFQGEQWMNSGGSFQTASMNRSFCLMLNRSNSMSTKKIAKIFGIIILAAVITAESAAQADELFTQAAALIRRAALFHSRRSPAQGRRFLPSVILLELRCNRDRLYAQGTGKQPEHKLLQAVLMKS